MMVHSKQNGAGEPGVYRSDLRYEKGLGVIVRPLAEVFGTVGDGNEHPRKAMVVGRKQHHVWIPVRQRLYDSTSFARVDGLVAEVDHRLRSKALGVWMAK